MVIVLPDGQHYYFFLSATLLFVNKMPTKKVQRIPLHLIY